MVILESTSNLLIIFTCLFPITLKTKPLCSFILDFTGRCSLANRSDTGLQMVCKTPMVPHGSLHMDYSNWIAPAVLEGYGNMYAVVTKRLFIL